jgi:flagellar protein FlgJ
MTADVPQWSWMQALGETTAGRIHVRLYASSLHALVADGWIPADDVGPSGPPQQSVYTAATTPAPSLVAPSHDAFITSMAAATAAAHASIPASVTIAQAILESNWGQSALSREANNYFGIKATGGIGSDGAVWMPTLEYVNGGSYTVVAPFRAYRSLADSVADHAALLQQLSIYRSALQATNDPDEFARRIARAGYATDPAYADKLIGLMQRYNLYQFDSKAPPANPAAA